MWDRTARGEPLRDAFRATYPQEDWSSLAERAACFAQKIEDRLTVPSGSSTDSVRLVVTTVAPIEIETALGDLLVQQGRTGRVEAEALYQAALARNRTTGRRSPASA